MAPKKQTPTPTPTPTQSPLRRSPRLSGGSPAAEPPQKKLKTQTTPKKSPKKSPKAKAKKTPEASGSKRKIIVEHCTQCRSFRTRAEQVRKGLEEAVAGVEVVINPEKPRKGCFEIREEDGEAFVALHDMTRPFTPMKDLVMEDVISDIVQRLQ